MSTLGKNLGVQKINLFLDEGVMRLGGVLGWQVPRLYGGAIFGGCNTLGASSGALNTKVPVFFDTFASAWRVLSID